MPRSVDQLPDDIDALKALLAGQRNKNDELFRGNDLLSAKVYAFRTGEDPGATCACGAYKIRRAAGAADSQEPGLAGVAGACGDVEVPGCAAVAPPGANPAAHIGVDIPRATTLANWMIEGVRSSNH